MSKLGTATNKVTVRKNTGGNVGTRSRLNLIEGANITLTVSDDAGDDEVDITITSGAGGGGGSDWLHQFFPAVDTNAYKGTYATLQMIDAVDTDVWQTFLIPADIATITRAVVLLIPNGTGNTRWAASTNFGAVCSNEDYQTHTDSIAATDSAVTQNEIECIDISSGLTGALGGDLVGLKFTRYGSHANDTISGTVHYVGVLVEGTT